MGKQRISEPGKKDKAKPLSVPDTIHKVTQTQLQGAQPFVLEV